MLTLSPCLPLGCHVTCVATFGKLIPFGYLTSKIVKLSIVSIDPFDLLCLHHLSLQPLAHSPPSLHILSSHNTSTINALNQPPLGRAGVRFLSCTRSWTKRRRRLYDLPMSRNSNPFRLTSARGQYRRRQCSSSQRLGDKRRSCACTFFLPLHRSVV